MLYDKNPPYAFQAHLPFAKEPLKSLYVFQRLFTTLALVPIWTVTYSVLPRRYRPRESWSIKQIIQVKFLRRIYKVTEVAGVTWGTHDPTVDPDLRSLKETRFIRVDPLPLPMRTGIVQGDVEFKSVGCYVWPKEEPVYTRTESDASPGTSDSSESYNNLKDSVGSDDQKVHLIGIFMHGGGYCHMSAHESSRTSRIPRELIKRKIMHEVFSVEYRLLQVAPFPAQLQDAAAIYAHVADHYSQLPGKYKIVLIGDSSGGNLALALARWIRDESHLPIPDGLLLLSPSCDISHAIPETLSSYVPRPNAETDFLTDSPEPQTLLQRTFLGFKYQSGPNTVEEERRLMEVVHSEYVSPCSPFVLHRWGHDIVEDIGGVRPSHLEVRAVKRMPLHVKLAIYPENLTSIEDSPYHKSSRFPKLFGDFPKTLVLLGEAERLVREVRRLVGAMEKDGVDVKLHVSPDAVHDILMMNPSWWDGKVIEETWRAVEAWGKKFSN